MDCTTSQHTSAHKAQETAPQARPFLKWAGGKGKLLPFLREVYPRELGGTITKYAEPFVGGGAVLLDILGSYSLQQVYISDSNPQLMNAYTVIRDRVEDLCQLLVQMQETYLALDEAGRKAYYYALRQQFNDLMGHKGSSLLQAADMIFLNRTCFNGLYRVNQSGQFNVPMGRYRHPRIADTQNLQALSRALAQVEIICGDYRFCEEFLDEHTFAYFDPPYRPLSKTSSFTSYTEGSFADPEQMDLAHFILRMSREKGAWIAASNADPHNTDPTDNFFDDLYRGCCIRRIDAGRAINAKQSGRGKIKELLITTY